VVKKSNQNKRAKVLLLENISEKAVKIFTDEGYDVSALPHALSEDDLIRKIKGISILGIRSKTVVTSEVLAHADRLLAIGAFCIGTNQIRLQECIRNGVIVFNDPYNNTRSVAELVIGEIVVLLRRTFEKSIKLHEGIWDKSVHGCFEVRGKKLGIIGYGNIGAQLSVLAEAFGMDVYFYDTAETLAIGKARKCSSLSELLRISDVITVHVDGRPENKSLIGEKEFAQMKKGCIFMNLSRGFVVDIPALASHLRDGSLAGAAVDVFPHEPEKKEDRFTNELQGLPNVILTPHVGGNTIEAQQNIGIYVAQKIVRFINTGDTTLNVNAPSVALPKLEGAHRVFHIHHNVSGVLANINRIFGNHGINIVGQHLTTNESIGVVVTDIASVPDKEIMEQLKNVEETIKVRIIY
jgi:D-3-phosphoglycerate dehydrogenase / 2-oxoglutarate reductase